MFMYGCMRVHVRMRLHQCMRVSLRVRGKCVYICPVHVPVHMHCACIGVTCSCQGVHVVRFRIFVTAVKYMRFVKLLRL